MPLRRATVKSNDNGYQLAVDNGYMGTEEEWLLMIKGAQELIVSVSEPAAPVIGTIWVIPV